MVEIVPYNPRWAAAFATESHLLGTVLGAGLVALHHIGSTAIAGIHAKPVIDMLAVATSLDTLAAAGPGLAALGYRAMGSYGIEGRRYFRKDDAAGRRTHHLHGYAAGSPQIVRHLAFRDYLRAHPGIAQQYSSLKRQLVADCDDYIGGKAPFVLAIQAEAMAWYRRQSPDY